ncbi:MAG: uroporphyrinogen-III synthase [Chloroflexi bacterium]|nr:uroporphyrinogen-III synthase [Chloroflexota bacterium]
MASSGKVFLVEAGPGDPGLITLKGVRCIEQADVIVYDRLVDPQTLQGARPGVELVCRDETIAPSQDEVSSILVDRAEQGKVVVRLESDPLIHGSIASAATALAEAGIPFEIVPGVTSAIAVPAYAGIPVAHSGRVSTVTIVVGGGKTVSMVPSAALAVGASGPGTLISLTDIAGLAEIVEQLLASGRHPETPVAVISRGTGPEQETVVGTLADVVAKADQKGRNVFAVSAAGAPVVPVVPVVIVVGEVVGLRERLRWFDNRPLFGKRVLVTRAREQAGTLSRLLEQRGALPVEAPAVQIEPPTDPGPIDEAIRRLDGYDWTIFTSANGVKAFMDRLDAAGSDVRALKGVCLCAIGPATAEALKRRGLRIDFVPSEFVAEAIVEGLRGLGVEGKRILLPRAEVAREVLPIELRNAGATVDEVAAYRTTSGLASGSRVARMIADGAIDVVTFTSSSTVRNLLAGLAEDEGGSRDRWLDSTVNACIGPITARTAEQLGVRVDVVATEYTVNGLVEAIVEYYKSNRARAS